jgi:hypothetical protein
MFPGLSCSVSLQKKASTLLQKKKEPRMTQHKKNQGSSLRSVAKKTKKARRAAA